MKKLFVLVLALLFVLCSCSNPQDTSSDLNNSSQLTQSEQGSSEISKPRPTPTLEKYVGKEKYESVSPGWKYLAQDDECYYYVDFDEFFSIDKKTGKRTAIEKMVAQVLFRFEDNILIYDRNNDLLIFNMSTKQITKKSTKKVFTGDDLFMPTLYMMNEGFIATGLEYVYYVDDEFEKIEKLEAVAPSVYDEAFVLGNEVFYLGEDYNAYCYNLETKKNTYITNYTPTGQEAEGLTSTILDYLGNGNILVYGDEKLQIINLTTGTSHAPYTKQELDKIQAIDTVYNEGSIFLLTWVSETDYYIDKLDPKTYKKDRIYEAKWKAADELDQGDEHQVGFTDCDENYIYLRDHSSFENGHDFRIKTDGSGKEILFNHMGEEHYSIEKYE